MRKSATTTGEFGSPITESEVKDLTRKELLHLLDEALYCLKDYRQYGQDMRKIGRGYSGTGSRGQSIDSVIHAIQQAVNNTVI